ncbi:hypothetical protein F0P96_04875 [Hymenobacter busanensis]|uniref:Uncharacterized protein n=1 Tax=Hymenobacter busanensis TaxID=2607656 RepID=A0A7L5A3Z6_9BACT|nr:hypothetical protein [Hymenobacter busanensis]KAA9338183.1 hypothetical protein F0P96_04875 [Hymenobacter busanensis]QHJ09392.1 hypothetical protein GUY19_19735 [Hymenobacter busanensis]
MKPKLLEWLRRYLPAELLSLLATLAGAYFGLALSGSRVTAALAATWAGNVAYFGTIIGADVWRTRRELRARGRPYRWATFGQNVRALLVEFGVAEVADSFVIRPALLYYLPLWLGSLAGGVLLAKLLADVTFYVPAIVSYELSKKRLRRFD